MEPFDVESIRDCEASVGKQTTVMGWLQKHLQEFVQPVLGYIPETSKDNAQIFSPQEMSIIKNMWRSVKREAKRVNKPILLAGRDVWIFEVLARRENTPTVFRPDISRLTATHVLEDYSKHFLFDTGFLGSIPRALRCESYTMGSACIIAPTYSEYARRTVKHQLYKHDTKQVFPRMKGARSLILKIERTPKYWRRGFYRAPCVVCGMLQSDCGCGNKFGIHQELAAPEEFSSAAILTIQIYKDNSPSFVNEPVNVTGHYTGTVYGSDW